MHSYGGQVGTDALIGLSHESRAAQGLPGGVSYLVYLTAFALPEGTGIMDKFNEFDDMDLPSIENNDDPQIMSLVGPSTVTEDEVDRYLATLVPWSQKRMCLPIKHAAWREIPVAYIYTTADMMVPFEYQKIFVEDMEKAGRSVQTFELATGHFPNLTATEGVVEAINKIVFSSESELYDFANYSYSSDSDEDNCNRLNVANLV